MTSDGRLRDKKFEVRANPIGYILFVWRPSSPWWMDAMNHSLYSSSHIHSFIHSIVFEVGTMFSLPRNLSDVNQLWAYCIGGVAMVIFLMVMVCYLACRQECQERSARKKAKFAHQAHIERWQQAIHSSPDVRSAWNLCHEKTLFWLGFCKTNQCLRWTIEKKQLGEELFFDLE